MSALTGLAAVIAALAIAGCGSSSSEESKSEPAGKASAEATQSASEAAPEVSAEELQNTVNTVMVSKEITAESLPPIIKEALERATPTPSKATMEKAFECWKNNGCTVGSGKVTVALADGFADNTWRKFAKMDLILQALTYPQVGKIITTDAHAKLATFESNIRTLTANGANIIIVYNDFGKSAYPAFEQAKKAGVVMSSYTGPDEGASLIAVQADYCELGKKMAEATKEAIGSNGPVAYFTGTPGNPQDAAWQKCATEAGMESVFEGVTDWTPEGSQKAASALIASGKPVKAILYSYSNPVPSIVQTYQKANKQVPAIVVQNQNNETTCQWKELKSYKLYQTNGFTWSARVSVTASMDELEGKEVPKELIYPVPVIPASPSECEPSKPGEYPGASALVPEELANKILGGS